MTQLQILYLCLGLAFVLAPLATNRFFLRDSPAYRACHVGALAILAIGLPLGFGSLAYVWPLFCGFGFILFLVRERGSIGSVRGFSACLPFAFSLISATWFVAGVNDLGLLGYDPIWSFYAALHGGFLGWLLLSGFASIARRPGARSSYGTACYLCFICFLLIAYGIDGIPYTKKLGVVGLALVVPYTIARYALDSRGTSDRAALFAALSLLCFLVTFALAVANEFWADFPRVVNGFPTMVLAHGLVNALVAIPTFLLAVDVGRTSR